MTREFSIQVFRDMLKIDKHDLDEELSRHSEVMDRIGERVSRLRRKADGLKDELATEESQLVLDIEREFVGSKMTVAQVSALVRTSSRRKRASALYLDAKQELEEWEALRGAWEQRSYSLSKLSELYVASYFTINSTSSAEPKPRIDEYVEDRQRVRRAIQDRPAPTSGRRVLNRG